MNRIIKAQLSKIKFLIGLNPKVEHKCKNPEQYIPEGYKAVCLISADLELAWAFRFSKITDNPIPRAVNLGLQTRKNVPIILDLCERYNIPITWAEVGHLFLEKCERNEGIVHPEIKRLPKFNNEFWEYKEGDWFDADPCSDYRTDPAWYAPDLIKQIIESSVGHEIGCHTFSHIDCRDAVCSDEVFYSEMNLCLKLAGDLGINLKSFVHPGHQIGHLDDLVKLGFTSFRTNNSNLLGYPLKDKSGLWNFQNTAEIKYRKDWSDRFNLYKYKRIIDRAVHNRKLIVFWFHPSFDNLTMKVIFPFILDYLDKNRNSIWITTHDQYASFLKNMAVLNG